MHDQKIDTDFKSLSLGDKLKDIMKDFQDKKKIDTMWPELTQDNKDKYFDKINIEIDVKKQKVDVHTTE